jgi:8-oxo-dGTP pyrophosphatase MutT (NUDIX family)
VHSVAMTGMVRNVNLRLAKLRKKARDCEQVAAVCYRIRGGGIEFLLVRTRARGRWTFPKGNAEVGLTHAQAAAMEAFEEAGVHGCMEEALFVRYISRSKSGTKGVAVSAHLCEVLRLCPPKECKRNRTWFTASEAKLCLREGRRNEDAAELVRVVGRAVARIERLRLDSGTLSPLRGDSAPPAPTLHDEKDGLRSVKFEAFGRADAQLHEAAGMAGDRRRLGTLRQVVTSRVGVRHETGHGEVLGFNSPRHIDRTLKLIAGVRKLKA